ncbi:pentapeptide repeat-containing protein [Burkholderia ambifaria]|uniref:pentapeptide repeat-containing protein n=1 Tax=Burkholderia ambifaria TaxID=152480 RepID=UPI001E4C8F23|nr:pentapeptide repeat-containing protein [Burkholderia ambifaria]UEP23066.1 pentapeptide repeat-containing protein [Burkholderia ambifaria]
MSKIRSAVPPPLPEVVEGQRYVSAQRDVALADTLFVDCHFERVEWTGCRLSNLRFVNCTFDANRFDRCELEKLWYESSRVRDGAWTQSALQRVSFNECEIDGGAWAGCLLKDVVCSQSRGGTWTFDAVRGAHVSLIAGDYAGIMLRGGHWRDTSWIGSRLVDLQLESVELENLIAGRSGFERVVLAECRGINVRWIDSRIEQMTVQGCELKQAAWSHSAWVAGGIHASRLPIASFDHASVNGLTVTNSELPQAIFDSASVADSALQGVRAPRIALRDAWLTRVNLAGAQLQQLDARGVHLERVDLRGADCRSGNLIGQLRQTWAAADTREAVFEEATNTDEQIWWQRNYPGARRYDDEHA